MEAAHRMRERGELVNHEFDNRIIEITRRFSEMSHSFENRLLQAMNCRPSDDFIGRFDDRPGKSNLVPIPEMVSERTNCDEDTFNLESHDHDHSIYRANYPIVRDPVHLSAETGNEDDFFKSLERKLKSGD